MSESNQPLPIRQSIDGKWEVENEIGNWIKCNNEADARILSNAPILLHKTYEVIPPNEIMAAEIDKTAEMLDKYKIGFGARFFRNRAKMVRAEIS